MNSSELSTLQNFCLKRLWPELPSIPHFPMSWSLFRPWCRSHWSKIPSTVLHIIVFISTSAEVSDAFMVGTRFCFNIRNVYREGKQFGCKSLIAFRKVLYFLSERSKSKNKASALDGVKHFSFSFIHLRFSFWMAYSSSSREYLAINSEARRFLDFFDELAKFFIGLPCLVIGVLFVGEGVMTVFPGQLFVGSTEHSGDSSIGCELTLLVPGCYWISMNFIYELSFKRSCQLTWSKSKNVSFNQLKYFCSK